MNFNIPFLFDKDMNYSFEAYTIFIDFKYWE